MYVQRLSVQNRKLNNIMSAGESTSYQASRCRARIESWPPGFICGTFYTKMGLVDLIL